METFDLSVFIHQLRSLGLDPERPKIEVKREWYNLGDCNLDRKARAENEFLKDLVATANTPGLTGYIIIGVDKSGKLIDSPFSQSGLRDQTDLRGIVVKRVSEPVDFELEQKEFDDNGNKKVISVIKIPPSLQKPHVIKLYKTPANIEIQNYIPIRKNTAINAANKYDIDFMYYDKKNIEPDYTRQLALSFFRSNLEIAVQMNDRIKEEEVPLLRFDTESWVVVSPLLFAAHPNLADIMLRAYHNFKQGHILLDVIYDYNSHPRYPKDFMTYIMKPGMPSVDRLSEMNKASWQLVLEQMNRLSEFLSAVLIPHTELVITAIRDNN